jgi:hypothetical protein
MNTFGNSRKLISVGRLTPRNQWDTTLIDALIDGQLYPHGLDVRRYDGFPPYVNGCVLIVPGRYWYNRIDEINKIVDQYNWLLLIRTSDEEDLFDIHQVRHNNARYWVQTPKTTRDYGPARLFGVGYTPHTARMPADPPVKDLDVFLAAQETHQRRKECFHHLQRGWNRKVMSTHGFTQGHHPDLYARHMIAAKVAPAPSGPHTPDTFRLWEALEAHSVPIADDITPGYNSAGYWRMLFPDAPFPILTDYHDLNGWIDDQLRLWPENANRITAWWMREKRKLAHQLRLDLEQLGAL